MTDLRAPATPPPLPTTVTIAGFPDFGLRKLFGAGLDQSLAQKPSAIDPGGHGPSKSCSSGSDQSQEKLEGFLRQARAL